MASDGIKLVTIEKFSNENGIRQDDHLAVEEPLEIRVGFDANGKRIHKPVSITMRTPGNDFELAAGFLYTEGIISSASQIKSIKHCGPKLEAGAKNTVRVDFEAGVSLDMKTLERNFYTTSSCGVCGKSSIEALSYGLESRAHLETAESITVSPDMLKSLPARLAEVQTVFERTGGLHASALFDVNGNLAIVREDVGRHNALDKVIGEQFLQDKLPLTSSILLLSGRISFELVQKALMASIPIIVAVGSPSSLAVELAEEYGMTLVGFVRENRFNIYCGKERIL